MADQNAPVSGMSTAIPAAQTEPLSGSPSSDYKPAVGDVVEDDHDIGMVFEYDGDWKWIAIDKPANIDDHDSSIDMQWLGLYGFIHKVKLVSKTEHRPTTWNEGFKALKAYFSKPQFKVGDVVKVVRKSEGCDFWTGECSAFIGKVITVENIDCDGDIQCLETSHSFPPDALELVIATFTPDPDKSYAENQAAWVKNHGLEVGSEVKVVRKFEDREGGFVDPWWGNKDYQIGKVYAIDYIDEDLICLNGNHWPYFVLEPVK